MIMNAQIKIDSVKQPDAFIVPLRIIDGILFSEVIGTKEMRSEQTLNLTVPGGK